MPSTLSSPPLHWFSNVMPWTGEEGPKSALTRRPSSLPDSALSPQSSCAQTLWSLFAQLLPSCSLFSFLGCSSTPAVSGSMRPLREDNGGDQRTQRIESITKGVAFSFFQPEEKRRESSSQRAIGEWRREVRSYIERGRNCSDLSSFGTLQRLIVQNKKRFIEEQLEDPLLRSEIESLQVTLYAEIGDALARRIMNLHCEPRDSKLPMELFFLLPSHSCLLHGASEERQEVAQVTEEQVRAMLQEELRHLFEHLLPLLKERLLRERDTITSWTLGRREKKEVRARDIAQLLPAWWTGSATKTIAAIAQSLRSGLMRSPTLYPTGQALRRSPPLCGEWNQVGLDDGGINQTHLSGVFSIDAPVALDYALRAAKPLLHAPIEVQAEDLLEVFSLRGEIEVQLLHLLYEEKLSFQQMERALRKMYGSRGKVLTQHEENSWLNIRACLGMRLTKKQFEDLVLCGSEIRSIARGKRVAYKEGDHYLTSFYLSRCYITQKDVLLTIEGGEVRIIFAQPSAVFRIMDPLKLLGEEHCLMTENNEQEEHIMRLSAPDRLWLEDFLAFAKKYDEGIESYKKQLNREREKGGEGEKAKSALLQEELFAENDPLIFGATHPAFKPQDPQFATKKVDQKMRFSNAVSSFPSTLFIDHPRSCSEIGWRGKALLGTQVEWIVAQSSTAEKINKLFSVLVEENHSTDLYHPLIYLSFKEFALLYLLQEEQMLTPGAQAQLSPTLELLWELILVQQILTEHLREDSPLKQKERRSASETKDEEDLF